MENRQKYWRFEKKLDNETGKCEPNYKIVYSTPIRVTETNSCIHCTDAASSIALRVAANRGTGYCYKVPTMQYEQRFIVHCWQFASAWEREQHMPTSVNVDMTINMPMVNIPLECVSFTPSINVENILESIKPFEGFSGPCRIDSIDIHVYLFIGDEPVISVEYSERGPSTYGLIADNTINSRWNEQRETEIDVVKNEIVARYTVDDDSPENYKSVCELMTHPYKMAGEYEKIKTKYPEIYKWYCGFIDERKAILERKYPEYFKDAAIMNAKIQLSFKPANLNEVASDVETNNT